MAGDDPQNISGRPAVLVDSNILLLLVAGRIDRLSISRFKRTAQYSSADFDCLVRFLDRFGRIVTTPNVLTEVNGFLSQFKAKSRDIASAVFGRVIELLDEKYIASGQASQDVVFQRLGLTDASISVLAAQRLLVLTDDSALRDALVRRDLAAVNFNYLRSLS